MGVSEWLLLVVITIYGCKTYQKQDYWLDRQIAKLIKYIRSRFR
jgi:hypothetical protein